MALVHHPALLIADEPTTALDVTIQDEILQLLKELKTKLGMAMIFITHNMGIVKNISDRMAVMYAGHIVELGKTADVLAAPKHPYTQALLRSLPKLTGSLGTIPVMEGQPPEPSAMPAGCPFHPRCDRTFERCEKEDPFERDSDGRRVQCHLF